MINKLSLKSEVHKTEETKGLRDKDNPLDPINNLHSLAKRFFKSYGSYNREDLQDWLNLFWFIMNEPQDSYDKVLLFIKMAVKTHKMVRYREIF